VLEFLIQLFRLLFDKHYQKLFFVYQRARYARNGDLKKANHYFDYLMKTPTGILSIPTIAPWVAIAEAVLFAAKSQWKEADESFKKAFEISKKGMWQYSNLESSPIFRKNYIWALELQGRTEARALSWGFLEKGYAYAASSFGEGGFPIQKAMIRTHQLTEYVINNYGVTGKVFLCGVSMGGAIVLLLGEKYPDLYDGVLDVVGLKDVTNAYITCETLINSPAFPSMPAMMQAFLLQAVADYEAECGGTVYDKPKAYERISPTCHADISIPTISVHGAQDPMVPMPHALLYGAAVAEAGCSEYYKMYVADPCMHADAPVQALALSVFDELVNYPDGW
jgi:hypothetical protein